MAFLQRRLFSTNIRRQNIDHYQALRPSLAIPAPSTVGAVLSSPELQQLGSKAKGPWKEFTKEEAVQLYRATFPKTYKEIRAGPGHYKIVVPAVAFGIGLSYVIYWIMGKTVGPTLPHTVNNPEWEAATLEKLIKDRANPITGVSSKYAKHNKVKAQA